jgi:hypothetical protein
MMPEELTREDWRGLKEETNAAALTVEIPRLSWCQRLINWLRR